MDWGKKKKTEYFSLKETLPEENIPLATTSELFDADLVEL